MKKKGKSISSIENYKKFIRKIPYIILILIIIYLFILLIPYNSPNNVNSKLTGIFIDSDSSKRGVSINKIVIDSYDEAKPDSNSSYLFGASFNNYSPPVYMEVYLPYDIEITQYVNKINLGYMEKGLHEIDLNSIPLNETQIYPLNARVVDGNILQIVFNDTEAPYFYYQFILSANIFKSETPDRYVFKSFKIEDNPIPFMKSGKFIFQNNNIQYSLKIERNKYRVDLSESNFIPEIRNEITGDFNYERINWYSQNTPVESILYISDIEKTGFKQQLNLFGVLFLGIFLGSLFEKIMKVILSPSEK